MSNKKLIQTIATAVDSRGAQPSATNSIATVLQQLSMRSDRSENHIQATPEVIEHLAASGISVKNICGLFNKSFQYLSENPDLQAAFERGRAHASSRLRSTLLDAALNDRNIQSAIYLDKIMSGDTVASEVNITVGQSQLSTVSDEDLLKVAFTVEGDLGEEGENLGGGGHTPEE